MNNQLMEVKLGNFGIVNIFHKTMMGKASDVMAVGNLIREQKGLRAIALDEILKSQNFWEYAVSYYNMEQNNLLKSLKNNTVESNELELTNDFKEVSIDYDLVRNSRGQINYKELVKKFPSLIQTKRGRYGGTWLHLFLILKLATKLDTDLEVAIYDEFINGKILQFIDDGGEAFKEFNKLVTDKLYGGKIQNQFIYINLAKVVNERVNGKFSKGWNEKEKDAEKQEYRAKILDRLCFLLDGEYVSDIDGLNKAISKL